ncbi:FG-GAP repeat domain-containing protein, partial [Streptomyces sp. NPDC058953]|uniref:FG-GAP repeat domain-containing protein n=1 Tax=Streptomyces sp. NPDC058953 TaxID=3346676 RepID=UPI00369659CF
MTTSNANRTRTRTRTRALSRLAVAALTAALVATGTSAVAADESDKPGAADRKAGKLAAEIAKRGAKGAAADARSAAPNAAEQRALYAFAGGELYGYGLDGLGGYQAREWLGSGWEFIKNATQADNDGDGWADDVWLWDQSGYLHYSSAESPDSVLVGGGWNIYNHVFSPGNLAGGPGADLLARDSAGALWIYLGHGDGRVTAPVRIGGGWNVYDRIAGVGDLTGDGRSDITAVDKSGDLWLYEGTGEHRTPFKPRAKVGWSWNIYNGVVGVGDLDLDGKSDLIARDKAGALGRRSLLHNSQPPLPQW